jgi:hypothetical protein
MRRIKGTDHILELPEGSKLLVKDRFWQIQSIWIDVWCRPRADYFPARVIRLTLTVESKSRNAASASKSMRATKNGSKKKVGIRF